MTPRLSGSDWRVLTAVIYLTALYSKMEDNVFVAQVAELADLDYDETRKVLRRLRGRGLIVYVPQRGRTRAGAKPRTLIGLPEPENGGGSPPASSAKETGVDRPPVQAEKGGGSTRRKEGGPTPPPEKASEKRDGGGACTTLITKLGGSPTARQRSELEGYFAESPDGFAFVVAEAVAKGNPPIALALSKFRAGEHLQHRSRRRDGTDDTRSAPAFPEGECLGCGTEGALVDDRHLYCESCTPTEGGSS